MLWLSTGTLDQWGLGGRKGRREGEEGRSKWSEEEREIERKEERMAGENQAMNIYKFGWYIIN